MVKVFDYIESLLPMETAHYPVIPILENSSITLPKPRNLYAIDTLSFFQPTHNNKSASIIIP